MWNKCGSVRLLRAVTPFLPVRLAEGETGMGSWVKGPLGFLRSSLTTRDAPFHYLEWKGACSSAEIPTPRHTSPFGVLVDTISAVHLIRLCTLTGFVLA
jgi:hypothetical protein